MLLRREDLYSSNLNTWRRHHEQGMLAGLTPKRRGPKPRPDAPLIAENEWLKRENQRLAAIHSFAHFIGLRCPEYIAWSTEIHHVPFKKSTQVPMPYLEKDEIDALIPAPDRSTGQGRRDHRILLFLYNSGAHDDEAAHLTIADLDLSCPHQ
ncbi:MAG: hypothetical protein JW829_19370 [Pirellulales bacterium]|nr:hypothetical protein [Pirellulales bacterium]